MVNKSIIIKINAYFLGGKLSNYVHKQSPILSVTSVWFWLEVLHHFDMLFGAPQCCMCCFVCNMETDVANHVTCEYTANQNRFIMTSSESLFKVRLPRIHIFCLNFGFHQFCIELFRVCFGIKILCHVCCGEWQLIVNYLTHIYFD